MPNIDQKKSSDPSMEIRLEVRQEGTLLYN